MAESAIEGAEAMLQRVWALLGCSCASPRKISTETPDRSAASDSRRLAVSPHSGQRPHISTSTAAIPPHRAASAAARSISRLLAA